MIGAAVVAASIVALAGCATGMKGSARRTCYDSGLQPGTQEFKDCWKGIARRDNAEVGEFLTGVAIGAAATQARRPTVGSTESFLEPKKPKECVYWTTKGKRVMQPVHGVCPLEYGE